MNRPHAFTEGQLAKVGVEILDSPSPLLRCVMWSGVGAEPSQRRQTAAWLLALH
jgi:hypothetical protein